MASPASTEGKGARATRDGSMWSRLKGFFHEAPVTDASELTVLLDQQSAFIAQKCAVDYCRGKTGLFSHQLFDEREFQDALAICRWETFAAVLADLVIVTESQLREAAGLRAVAVADRLARLYREILESHPLPPHRPRGWADVVTDFERRFGAARRAESQAPSDIARHAAARLFETLPIHAGMRQLDEPIVHSAVRFHVTGFAATLRRRLVGEKVVADLLEQ